MNTPPLRKRQAVWTSTEPGYWERAIEKGGVPMSMTQVKDGMYEIPDMLRLLLTVHTASGSVSRPIKFFAIPRTSFNITDFTGPSTFRYTITSESIGINGMLDVGRYFTAFGAQKSCNLGKMTLDHVEAASLGHFRTSNCSVAVKRLFTITKTPPPGATFDFVKHGGRMFAPEEFAKTCDEANLLYWAFILTDMVQQFVDAKVSSRSEGPPFILPRIRFVEGGVGIVNQGVLTGVSKRKKLGNK
jgi:hypothetical protein